MQWHSTPNALCEWADSANSRPPNVMRHSWITSFINSSEIQFIPHPGLKMFFWSRNAAKWNRVNVSYYPWLSVHNIHITPFLIGEYIRILWTQKEQNWIYHRQKSERGIHKYKEYKCKSISSTKNYGINKVNKGKQIRNLSSLISLTWVPGEISEAKATCGWRLFHHRWD